MFHSFFKNIIYLISPQPSDNRTEVYVFIVEYTIIPTVSVVILLFNSYCIVKSLIILQYALPMQYAVLGKLRLKSNTMTLLVTH